MRGKHPNTQAALKRLQEMRTQRAATGLAYAREWRARNKPYFDAIYGAEA